jgi:hypothetical protein
LASDADGESLEFMKMSGPEWLQVDLDGTYSGTPLTNHAGVNEFTVRTADNRDGYAEATLRVRVGGGLMTVQPIHDTHVAQESPDSNYGSNAKLILRGDKYNTGMNGFLMFDIDTAGLGILSATLKLYCSHRDITLKIHDVADTTWTENSLTWNNQPSLGSNIVTRAVGTDVWEAFDVTGSVPSSGRVCFGLTSTVASYSNVDTKDGANPPVLELELAVDANDWDGDGLPNDWELAYFGGETNAVASGHSDEDLFDNLAEFIAGTDPTDSASYFRASTGVSPSGFVISWNAISNRTYGVWYASSPGTVFTNVQSDILHPQNTYTDTVHSAGAAGFYRVDVQELP